MSERLAQETVVDSRYRVINRIGSGGMADVYCAEDMQLGRKVALKILHERFAEDPDFVERFKREASSAAGLQHQHVVNVYDRGEWDGTSYIAMEYLPGRTLKQVIQQEAPLDPARAIELTTQVLRAARFAHRRGIIHRDLKPQNVILDAEDRLKVTDFGIARAGASDMTQTGSIMGTAQYLSPEQAQGHPVSAPSDLYSIGIILYELLTGRLPFEGDSAVTIALKQVNELPAPPSSLNPAVTPELESVVLRALEKDPLRRFPDADSFIAALEHARVGLGSGSEATTIVAPPPAATDGRGAPPPPAATVLAEEDRTHRRWWLWLLVLLLLAAAAAGAYLLLRDPGPPPVTVANVVGADEASARARLRADGLLVEAVRRNSQRSKGTVIAQDPSGGTRVDEGSTVNITVSDGPEQVEVPRVEGLTRRRARTRLEGRGFKVEVRTETNDSVRKGRAIRTSPPEGTVRDEGSTVTLVVSEGIEQVEVPDVSGQDADAAESQLRDAGFKVRRSDQVTTDSDPGTVLGQSPSAGESVDKGSTVTITVAKEPEEVDVPDILGEDQDTAVEALSGAGFEIDVQEQDVDSQEGDGVVLDQDPAGGGQARRGATVRITVGRFDPALAPDANSGGDTTTTTP